MELHEERPYGTTIDHDDAEMLARRKCWRVWLTDGSAVLVDAEDESHARRAALRLADEQGEQGARVDRAECLSL